MQDARDMHDMDERNRVDSWAAGMSWALCYPTRQQRYTEQPSSMFSTCYGLPGCTAALDGSAQVFKPKATMPKALPAFQALPQVLVAASKALGITELLEAVLSRLPDRTLLSVQRVSKAWQTAIEKSRALQERLFFQPAPSKHTFLVTRMQFESYAFTSRHRHRVLTVVQDRVPAGARSQGYLQSVEAAINPMVCSLSPPPYKTDIDTRAAAGERIRIHQELLSVWFGSTRAPPSIWNMYLTQPPTTRVTVSIFDDMDPRLTHRKIVKKAGGIKVGDILEAYSMLVIAWKMTVSANSPAYLVDSTMRTSQQPNLFVLFDPSQENPGNSILVASDRDIKVVQSRAELAAAEKGFA